MGEEKGYPMSEALFGEVNAIVTKLDGFVAVLNTLTENVERGKVNLWETIYAEYPELRGKMLKIDGAKQEIIVVKIAEASKIETLPED